MIKLIKNEEDYHTALEQIETLVTLDPPVGTDDADTLELLAFLVEAYEEEHFPLSKPNPIEAIRFRMEQQGLSQKDMVPIIGSKSKVSEVLSGKQPLTLRMIRSLHRKLGIPFEILIGENATLDQAASMEWQKFPVKEMYDLGWFSGLRSALDGWEQAKERTEELLREFFKDIEIEKLQEGYCRQKVRSRGQMNPYALLAWKAQVVKLARKESLPQSYSTGRITEELVTDLVRLSYLDEGPRLANEFLAKTGIHLIIVPRLRKTHLDGATMINADGAPIIALTLRYDRVDNFWFTLIHELAHLCLHLDKAEADCFIDDLDGEGDDKEAEADSWARNLLVPPDVAAQLEVCEDRTMIRSLAGRLRIHPAILAGRIRWEKQNFRIFSDLVGNGSVRRLLLA
jgi:HTH-type transcriptional regulator/antitoxin HigA